MQFFRDLSIRAQVLGLVLLLSALTLAVAWVGGTGMSAIGTDVDGLAGTDIPLLRRVGTVEEQELEQGVEFERALHLGDIGDGGQGALERAEARFQRMDKRAEATFQKAEALIKTGGAAGGGSKLADLRASLQDLQKSHEAYARRAEKVFALARKGDTARVDKLVDRVDKAKDELNHKIDALRDNMDDYVEQAASHAEHQEASGWRILEGTSGVALALGLVLGWLVSTGISRGLRHAAQVMGRVAESGDLSQEVAVRGRNEVGQMASSFNALVGELRTLFGEWHTESNQLATAIQELTATSDELTRNARSSSGRVEEVSGSAQEVNNVVQDVAGNISEVSDLASQSTEITKSGMESVGSTAQEIQRLRDTGQRVDELMETIQAIAKKTDLLALNAAIEAANAGEQGKGFAVVADEVRKLAEQTSEATGQVNAIVGEVRERSDASVASMEGVQEEMGRIMEMIERTDERANQIAAAAEELAATMGETTSNMNEIHGNVDHVASSVAQVEQAAHQLEGTATSLEEGLNRFRIADARASQGGDGGEPGGARWLGRVLTPLTYRPQEVPGQA
ncbi:MAG TPA: methyl-accepting chemotaxis protein [Gammaproteobacteria bacterium]|nr:methyl-accepting chemotaxis protein [Gammaproteobacteria bacterium]